MTLRRLLLLTLLVAAPAPGLPVELDLGGSYKSIFDYQRMKETGLLSSPDIFDTQQRLRLQASVSQDWWRIEFADELQLQVQKNVATTIPIPNTQPVSWWQATTRLINEPATQLVNRVDRLNLQLSHGPVEVRIGKQVIDEGVGHIFTAVSQIPRYPLTFLDQEYPMTEDAISVVWKGVFTFEARYLPRVPTQRGENFHLRAKGGKSGYDLALTGGRSDDKPYVAVEMAGNLGDSLLRGELVHYEWQGNSATQALVGWDRVFSEKLSVQVEAFYNGFGVDRGYLQTPLTHRSVPYRGRWYAGVALSSELSPRWKANLNTIVNLNDPSVLLWLVVNYSVMENVDLVVGQYMGLGNEASELGGKLLIPNPAGANLRIGLPNITYVELKYYF